jgi:hypothetical protein
MGRIWGRLYSGTRHHPKIRILRARYPKHWMVIYPLLEMSFEANDEGRIQVAPGQPYTLKELAREVGESVTNLSKIVQILVELRMISYQNNIIQFLSWNERQFTSDSDGAQRTRKWREKKRQSGDVTCDVTVTDQKQKQNHINIPPTSPPQTDSPSPTSSIDPTEPPRQASPDTSPEGGDGEGLKKKKKQKKSTPLSISPDFEQFYQHYPNRKGGKEKAWGIWQRRLKGGTLPPINDLMECLYRLTSDPDWMKEDGQYVPMITTFLNGGRWTDVDALKSNRKMPPPNRPDPNCPYCQGQGLEPAEKDGVKGMTICRCRRGK